MHQKQGLIKIVGEAGLIVGASSAAATAEDLLSGLGGSDLWDPLGLAQLLDQEAFVTAILHETKLI